MILAQTLREVMMASIPQPPRPKRHHDGRSIWRSRWYDDQAMRHDKTFGYTDEVGEKEAGARFNLWLGTWHTDNRIRNPRANEFTYSAKDLANDYLAHARKTFVKHGRQTSHVWEVAYAMQHLMDAFGDTPLSEIENPHIAALRNAMCKATSEDRGEYLRTVKTVNGRLFIIKAAFKWAREQSKVDKATLADVLAVMPLVAGRCEAKPSVKVKPVDEHWVALTKAKASRQVQAMIDLQWLTGMRPGETTIMRACDIDMSGEAWLYMPAEHKMEHKDQVRVIPLGSRCQAVIKPFLNRPTDAYLFSPAEAITERMLAKRQARKVKLWPSHESRYIENPGRQAGDKYTTESYRRGIHYACIKAKIESWNPNQLRHAAATRFNKMFDLEDVAVMVGHADKETTRIYALPDIQRAIGIAKKVG